MRARCRKQPSRKSEVAGDSWREFSRKGCGRAREAAHRGLPQRARMESLYFSVVALQDKFPEARRRSRPYVTFMTWITDDNVQET